MGGTSGAYTVTFSLIKTVTGTYSSETHYMGAVLYKSNDFSLFFIKFVLNF